MQSWGSRGLRGAILKYANSSTLQEFLSLIKEMSLEDAFKIIDKLAAIDAVSIFWSRGEPLQRVDYVWERIKYAWSKGIAASGQDLDQKTPIRDCIWWVILPGEKVV